MPHPKTALCATVLTLCLVPGVASAAATVPTAPSTPTADRPIDETSTTTSTGSQAAVKLGWGSVDSGDEFNYSGAPDATKWAVYDSAGHEGHGRRRASAWQVDGAVATVTGTSTGTTGGMSARFGRMKYGRWETRMKTNVHDAEYHPVLLLWPDVPTKSTCPEVDYAESSSDTTKVRFFLHYGCAPEQTRAAKTLDTTQWHDYAVEWTPTHITGYIDGVQFFSDTTASHLPPGSMHQTVQLDWFPDGTGTRTSTMSIDWVRVYQRR